MKTVQDENGKAMIVSDDTMCHPGKNGALPTLYTNEELAVIHAQQAIDKAEWDAGAIRRIALAEIARLEATITPRRLLDRLFLDEETPGWLDNVRMLIALERAALSSEGN